MGPKNDNKKSAKSTDKSVKPKGKNAKNTSDTTNITKPKAKDTKPKEKVKPQETVNLLSTTPELFPAVGGYLYTPVLLAPGNSSGRNARNGDATRPPLTSFLGCCRGSIGTD